MAPALVEDVLSTGTGGAGGGEGEGDTPGGGGGAGEAPGGGAGEAPGGGGGPSWGTMPAVFTSTGTAELRKVPCPSSPTV